MDLNEKTSLPLWSVLAAVPAIASFIVWIAFVAALASTNERDIKDLKQAKDNQSDTLAKIKEDVAFIRGRLEPKSK